MRAIVAAVLGLALTGAATRAQDAPPAVTGGAKVYRQAVPSVAWIQSTRTGGLATGSGALVDEKRRLVLTNYHVVQDNPRVTVFFPELRNGSPVPERDYYQDRAGRLGVPGQVVGLNKTADLAVIQIDKVPEGVKAIPLATSSPDPGEAVHAIGNAGRSGALFGYVRGTVRQVYKKKWQAALSPRNVATFDARVIETDSPTNPGDSGGPLLNDAGQLVGVTQGGATNAKDISYFIDITEVRRVLDGKLSPRADPDTAAAKEPAGPAKGDPILVKDEAGKLSDKTVEEANALVKELHKAGRPVLIETLKAAPAEWIDKAKKATPAERKKLFDEFALKRLKDEKTDGVIVLICFDPTVVAVQVSDGAKKAYPRNFGKDLGEVVLKALRNRDTDKAVLDALKFARDAKRD